MVSVEDEALTIEGDENSDVRDVVTPVVTVPGEIIVKVSLHEISGERCWHSTVICSVESVANITGLLLEKGQNLFIYWLYDDYLIDRNNCFEQNNRHLFL